jgi:hypothetical protein
MPKYLFLTDEQKAERQRNSMAKYRQRMKDKYGEDYWGLYQKKRYYMTTPSIRAEQARVRYENRKLPKAERKRFHLSLIDKPVFKVEQKRTIISWE